LRRRTFHGTLRRAHRGTRARRLEDYH